MLMSEYFNFSIRLSILSILLILMDALIHRGSIDLSSSSSSDSTNLDGLFIAAVICSFLFIYARVFCSVNLNRLRKNRWKVFR
jgi:hypothetical protein